jgi:SAM-dependent methyltransferase
MDNTEINAALSSRNEQSVAARGATLEAIWLDSGNAPDKCLRRCEAVFRMIDGSAPYTVLDVGCGLGFAVPFLEERYGQLMRGYRGIDVSKFLVAEANRMWPGRCFEVRDIIANPLAERSFDFTAINGILTAKNSLSHAVMEGFAYRLLEHCWHATDRAMSFNVMSPHVDWTREDLFHWPLDRAVGFCVAKLSRHVNVIADYGLYEYTVQVFRKPRPVGAMPAGWQATMDAKVKRGP